MKSIKINSNSWIIKFLRSENIPTYRLDTCSLFAGFIAAGLKVIFKLVVAAGVGAILGELLAWIFAGVIAGFVVPSALLIAFLMLCAMGFCAFVFVLVVNSDTTEQIKEVISAKMHKMCQPIELI